MDFSFDFTQKPTPKEIFETAAAARSAGYLIRQDELEEMTGYALEKDAATPPQGGFGGLANEKPGATLLQNAENRLQNAPHVLDGQSAPSAEESLAEALERVFQNALAEASAEALTKETAAAEEIGDEPVGADHRAAQPSQEELANENPYHCPKCGKFAGFNGHCEKCGYTLDADETQKRAERLIDKAMSGTMLKPIDGLAYRDEIGQVDLEVGKRGVGTGMERGTGLSKLKQKHGQDIHALAETLAHGTIMPTTKGTRIGEPYDPDRRAIVNGTYVIFLQRKGDRRWKVSTHYKSASDAVKSEEIKQWLRSGDQSHLQGGAE